MMHALLRTLAVAVLLLAAVAPLEAQTKPKQEPSAAQIAARDRQQKCSVEWKDAKAGGKLAAGTKWPQFWSACNKRLKGTNV